MCLYVIHVDLNEQFCRFQLKKEPTACCFELRVLFGFGMIFTINAKNGGRFKFPNCQTGECVA